MPAGLGTFSNGGLGMGVAFTLKDEFSNTADKIERSMTSLEGNFDAVAKRMDNSFKMVGVGIGSLAAGLAILTPMFLGLNNASDLAENLNKTDVAFGEYAQQVRDFAESSIDVFGIDKIRALDMASLFGDMSTGMGMAQKDAADMSIALTGLAGDLASFKNISHESAQTALAGIFTGETESLKQLGIVMTQANLDAFLAAKGITNSFKDLSQVEQIGTRFEFVMERAKNSVGDFARTADGFANSKRTMEGSLKELSATIGEIVMPIAAKFLQMVADVAKKMKDFAESPFGKAVLIAAAALGTFLVVTGVGLIVVGGMRLAMMQLAGAFADQTKAAILSTIAQKGVIAGFRQMAVAAWASLGPYIAIIGVVALVVGGLYLLWNALNSGSGVIVAFGLAFAAATGPIGLIVAGVMLIVRAVREFNKASVEDLGKGGFLGLLQQIGGVLVGIKELIVGFDWSTGSFELNIDTEKKLEAAGVLDFVKNIGGWLGRISYFFKGVKDTLTEVYEVVKTAVKNVIQYLESNFSPFTDKLKAWGVWFDSNSSSLESWQEAGKKAGYAIVAVLGAIGVAFIAMGISALVSMAPIILTVAAVALAIYGIYKATTYVKDNFPALYTAITQVFSNIWENVKAVGGFIVDVVISIFGYLSSVGKAFENLFKTGDFLSFIKDLGVASMKLLLDVGKNVIDLFLKVLDNVATPALDFIKNLVRSVVGFVVAQISAAISHILNAVKNVSNYFKVLWADIVQGITTAYNWIVSGVNAIANGLYDGLVGIADSIVQWFVDTFETVYTTVSNVFNSIMSIFTGETTWEDIKAKVLSIWSSLTTMMSNGFDVGKKFLQGIWDGIISVWDSFANWFAAKFDGLTGSFNIDATTSSDNAAPTTTSPTSSVKLPDYGNLFATQLASRSTGNEPVIIDRSVTTQQFIKPEVYLDGNQIVDYVNNKNVLNNNRGGN